MLSLSLSCTVSYMQPHILFIINWGNQYT